MINLFDQVSRAEAVSGIAGSTPGTSFCDDQFFVCAGKTLLFATLSPAETETHLPTPERLEWHPGRNDGLPATAIPRYLHDQARWQSQTHVFLRREPDTDLWLYCGTAHLASYSQNGPASYSFDAGRLPRTHWLKLGGYRGWELRINTQRHEVEFGDSVKFAELLADIPKYGMGHISVTRWEGDELSVHLNHERGFPMFLRTADDNGLYVGNGKLPGGETLEVFACPCCGIPIECPRRATLSRSAATELMLKFLSDGISPQVGDFAPESAIWHHRVTAL